MAGIRLWRCSRCEQVASVVVDGESTLLCGDCFYQRTVDEIMAVTFLPGTLPANAPARAGMTSRHHAAAG